MKLKQLSPAERILEELKACKEAGNCVCGTLTEPGVSLPACFLCKRIRFWERKISRGRAILGLEK